MTPDEVVAEAWKIADNDACDGVTFRAISDQWWGVYIRCEHGVFYGESNGQMDVSAGFERALEKFRQGHASP